MLGKYFLGVQNLLYVQSQRANCMNGHIESFPHHIMWMHNQVYDTRYSIPKIQPEVIEREISLFKAISHSEYVKKWKCKKESYTKNKIKKKKKDVSFRQSFGKDKWINQLVYTLCTPDTRSNLKGSSIFKSKMFESITRQAIFKVIKLNRSSATRKTNQIMVIFGLLYLFSLSWITSLYICAS